MDDPFAGWDKSCEIPTEMKTHLLLISIRGVRVEHFSYPTRVPDDAYPVTRTRPVPKLLPDPTRGYTRTRSLPVEISLLGTIGLVGIPSAWTITSH